MAARGHRLRLDEHPAAVVAALEEAIVWHAQAAYVAAAIMFRKTLGR